MKLFILKTDIKSQRQANKLGPVFMKDQQISRWTIDLDDVDKVLKVETRKDYDENDMINIVRSQGFHCEELPD